MKRDRRLDIKQNFRIQMLFRYNRAVRLLLWPVVRARRYWKLISYWHNGDGAEIRKLENIHFGERCFIIGNGPSLVPQDLDRLKNEVTFASNRIFYIFNTTNWRPSYYCCFDNEIAVNEIEGIKKAGVYPKFLSSRSAKLGRTHEDNIYYLVFYGKFHISPTQCEMNTLSEDISKYMTYSPTVTVNMIEMAIYMGFKEIYLLGVDHNYMSQVDGKGKIHHNDGVKSNHFAGVEELRGNGNVAHVVFNPDTSTEAYVLARQYAKDRNVKIYNATRGGKLEVFERVDFDELMKKE